jgi:hypothetical protein
MSEGKYGYSNHREETERARKAARIERERARKEKEKRQKQEEERKRQQRNRDLLAESEKKNKMLIDELEKSNDEFSKSQIKHREEIQQQQREFFDSISDLKKDVNKEIKNLQQDINTKTDELKSDISSIHKRHENADKQAQEWTNRMNSLIAAVKKERHEKFAPGKLKHIENKKIGLNNLTADAIVANAFDYTKDLLQLQVDIEMAEIEYNMMENRVIAEVDNLTNLMQEQVDEISFIDTNENKVRDENGNEIKIDLDFWSEGEYSELQTRLHELKTEIINGKDDPDFTLEKLREISEEIKEIDDRQQIIVSECNDKGNAAQIRANMADAIVSSLENQHYKIERAGYLENDPRNSYFIKLHQPDEDTYIDVLIHPKDDGECVVHLGTTEKGGNSNPELTAENAKSILRSLDNAGITVKGELECCDSSVNDQLKKLYDNPAILKSIGDGGKKIPKEVFENAKLGYHRRK